MDAHRFDRLVRTLNGAGSRRRLLREALAGLFGGVVVTLGSGLLDVPDTEAKRGKRSRKRKKQRSRKGRVQSERAAQANAGKVRICHFTGDPDNPYNVLEVSGNALDAHIANHGDFVINDEDGCCLDSDCAEFPNSFCDEDIDDGAQCACEPTDRDEACEGHCGETVGDGCGGDYECECGCVEVGGRCDENGDCCSTSTPPLVCASTQPGPPSLPSDDFPAICRPCVSGPIAADACNAPTPPTSQDPFQPGTSPLCCSGNCVQVLQPGPMGPMIQAFCR